MHMDSHSTYWAKREVIFPLRNDRTVELESANVLYRFLTTSLVQFRDGFCSRDALRKLAIDMMGRNSCHSITFFGLRYADTC